MMMERFFFVERGIVQKFEGRLGWGGDWFVSDDSLFMGEIHMRNHTHTHITH
jgi:hypothetical protein